MPSAGYTCQEAEAVAGLQPIRNNLWLAYRTKASYRLPRRRERAGGFSLSVGHVLVAQIDVHRGKPNRVNWAALVAFMALIVPALCACSGLSQPAPSSSRYLDLNDPPPRRDPMADQETARAKAELTDRRDNAERAASQQ
jgi:hypothetical protein